MRTPSPPPRKSHQITVSLAWADAASGDDGQQRCCQYCLHAHLRFLPLALSRRVRRRKSLRDSRSGPQRLNSRRVTAQPSAPDHVIGCPMSFLYKRYHRPRNRVNRYRRYVSEARIVHARRIRAGRSIPSVRARSSFRSPPGSRDRTGARACPCTAPSREPTPLPFAGTTWSGCFAVLVAAKIWMGDGDVLDDRLRREAGHVDIDRHAPRRDGD